MEPTFPIARSMTPPAFPLPPSSASRASCGRNRTRATAPRSTLLLPVRPPAMLIDDDRLHIAIQKNGRLSDISRDLLKGAGLRLQNGRNALTARVENFAADVMFVRDDDIPTFVADGACEFGIVGGNVLEEFRLSSSEPAVEIVAELGTAR